MDILSEFNVIQFLSTDLPTQVSCLNASSFFADYPLRHLFITLYVLFIRPDDQPVHQSSIIIRNYLRIYAECDLSPFAIGVNNKLYANSKCVYTPFYVT